jgi:hypothetical protein
MDGWMDGAHVVASRDDRLPPTGNHLFHYTRARERERSAVPGEAADKAIKRAPILVRPSSPPRSATAREQAPAGIKPPGSRTSRKPTRSGRPAGVACPAPCPPPRGRLAIQRERGGAGTHARRTHTHAARRDGGGLGHNDRYD